MVLEYTEDEGHRDDPLEVDDTDILDESEDDRSREIRSALFDDDPFADDGELDYEAEPSF